MLDICTDQSLILPLFLIWLFKTKVGKSTKPVNLPIYPPKAWAPSSGRSDFGPCLG